MPLFPAYASKEDINTPTDELLLCTNKDEPSSDIIESQLLTSDTEEEIETTTKVEVKDTRRNLIKLSDNNEFYIDTASDFGNLRVSTLYYPGRPEYHCKKGDHAAGAKGASKSNRKRRYYTQLVDIESDAPIVTQRAEAYQCLLAQNPEDITLWEKFIDFQESCGTLEGVVSAAEQATQRVPRSAVLRSRLLDALHAALPPHRYLERLRDMISGEKCPNARLALWERLVRALPAEASAEADAVTSATAAALADTRGAPAAYPRLLYAAGAFLRDAGLWERLVLLVELVVGMNYPSAELPCPSAATVAADDTRLAELEDKMTASGLPLNAVWVRVERARAAARWRPAPAHTPPPADTQRAPPPHAVADLLQPLVSADHLLLLSIHLLMLAKVPLLPGTEWAARGYGPAGADCAEALLPLLVAARELPPSHPAHPASAHPDAARRLLALALDPPHYFTDDTGYLSWVEALWDTCCDAAQGMARVALLCWRLRWLRALLLLVEEGEGGRGERERVRGGARAVLRRLRCSDPLPFAEFARLELVAAGPERALHAATHALRAALADDSVPRTHALYAARVVAEVSAEVEPSAGACALVCAVLGRAPPPRLCTPAPRDLDDARALCEERCQELESELAAGGEEGGAAALLPGVGEWARARVALAPPAHLQRLECALRVGAARARAADEGAAARYWEETAVALVTAAAARGRAAHTAHAVAPLYPNNAYLALASAGAPMWAWGSQSPEERLGALTARGDVSALASALPALLRAMSGEAPFSCALAADAAARALRRVTQGAGGGTRRRGALLWALRLEAEARAPRPRLPHALYAAVDAAPFAKWVYVRGAAWCGAEAGALEDALLERQLRLHALQDELRPAHDPVPTHDMPPSVANQT